MNKSGCKAMIRNKNLAVSIFKMGSVDRYIVGNASFDKSGSETRASQVITSWSDFYEVLNQMPPVPLPAKKPNEEQVKLAKEIAALFPEGIAEDGGSIAGNDEAFYKWHELCRSQEKRMYPNCESPTTDEHFDALAEWVHALLQTEWLRTTLTVKPVEPVVEPELVTCWKCGKETPDGGNNDCAECLTPRIDFTE